MRFSEKPRHLLQLPSRFLIAAVVLVAVAAHGGEKSGTIYSGGNIITYKQSDGAEVSQTVEAVGTDEHGKILFTGALKDVTSQMKGSYNQVGLGGKTLIPAFFDGHSHFVQVAYLPMFADLLPPPDGTVTTIKGIQESLLAYARLKGLMTVKIKDRDWKVVLGNGYDDSRLFGDGDSTKVPQGHPTRQQLDEVSAALGDNDILVCIFHQSGHYSDCNSAALNAAGYHDQTPGMEKTGNPAGGTIYRDAADHMTGLLGESAHIHMLLTVVPKIDDKTLVDGLKLYTSQGFTTVEDGRVAPAMLARLAQASKDFTVDVVAYPDLQMVKESFDANPDSLPVVSRGYEYYPHFRTGGVKLSLDGSPQGRSAWLTESYQEVPDGEAKDYRGEANIKEVETLKQLLIWAYGHNWQVLMHANGDATIDQLIAAETAAQKKIPSLQSRRTVLVHGQFLRANQIQPLRYLRVFPSLFPMHTYYWGDWYLRIVGNGRASFISPTKAVQDAKMMFSIHSDAPVTKPNSMRLLDSAVNRTSRNGAVLGATQSITPLVALKAMTIWPAYQHFEEQTKGSIEAGKQADFVVLSENPLAVAHKDLICIQILQTIKDGTPVYTNEDTVAQSDAKFAACQAEQAKKKVL